MRQVFTVMAVLIGGALGLGVSSHDAEAGRVPALSAPVVVPTLIEEAGYSRRSWRRRGYGAEIVIPDAEVDVDVDLNVGVDAPAIIVLPPPRPLSCGEYRYWNGDRCVDARYNNPYIGPR